MAPSRRGQLSSVGPRIRNPVARESWSKPPAFRRGPKSPGTADRPSGPSDQSTSGRGELVDPVSPWPWARVSQESWWTPWALGPGPDSPKPSDRPHRHSDNSVSLPGLLVHPTGNRTQARGARDSWSTPRAFRHGPESPGTTGGRCWPLGMGLIPLGEPFDTTGPRNRPWSPRTGGRPQHLRTRAPVARESVLTQQGLGAGPESPAISGLLRWASGTGPIRLGNLVEPAGHRTRTRVTGESWSTPLAISRGPESPETAGRPRTPGRPSGPSDPSTSGP